MSSINKGEPLLPVHFQAREPANGALGRLIRKSDYDNWLASTLHQSRTKQGEVENEIQFFIVGYEVEGIINNPSFTPVVQNEIAGPSRISDKVAT